MRMRPNERDNAGCSGAKQLTMSMKLLNKAGISYCKDNLMSRPQLYFMLRKNTFKTKLLKRYCVKILTAKYSQTTGTGIGR